MGGAFLQARQKAQQHGNYAFKINIMLIVFDQV